MTAQQARADLKASKARAKAMRPWYKKKRNILGLLVLAIIVIIIAVTVGGGSKSGTTAEPGGDSAAKKPATKTTAPAPASAKVGTAVTAGDWQFTVTDFKCGVKKVGTTGLEKKAQGQFCLMNVKVKNNGTESGTLLSSNQKLLDKGGREFSSDDEAAVYAGEDASTILDDINPGNTLKGLLVFDIPKGTTPIQASLAGGLMGMKAAVVDLT